MGWDSGWKWGFGGCIWVAFKDGDLDEVTQGDRGEGQRLSMSTEKPDNSQAKQRVALRKGQSAAWDASVSSAAWQGLLEPVILVGASPWEPWRWKLDCRGRVGRLYHCNEECSTILQIMGVLVSCRGSRSTNLKIKKAHLPGMSLHIILYYIILYYIFTYTNIYIHYHFYFMWEKNVIYVSL